MPVSLADNTTDPKRELKGQWPNFRPLKIPQTWCFNISTAYFEDVSLFLESRVVSLPFFSRKQARVKNALAGITIPWNNVWTWQVLLKVININLYIYIYIHNIQYINKYIYIHHKYIYIYIHTYIYNIHISYGCGYSYT